jgi:tRNA threonylcarbamoyladenosine biosynthesis protein TsaB
MSLILCLETATKACSVSLGQQGKLLALKESLDEQYSHAENLTLYIEEVFKQATIRLQDVDAVAVSKGPGSFTGLRIGISTAKGLCYALDKPLIAINTLEAMAVQVHKSQVTRPNGLSGRASHKGLFMPMIDARRMEVYYAVYDEQLNEIKKTSAEIIDENSFSDLLSKNKIYFFGDGAAKCRSKISHPNAIFTDGINPSAKFMLPLAEKYFSEKKFEDVAYFEPFYLKDFVGTKSSPQPSPSEREKK